VRITLQDVLMPETLGGLVETFSTQGHDHAVSRLFAKEGRRILPEGETASWDEVPFHRGLAPVTGPDSPHPQARRLEPRRRLSAMVTIKAYKDLPGGPLFLQRGLGALDPDAESEIARELEDLAQIISNTREYLAVSALLGRIDVTPRTIPGSELELTIAFGNHEAYALSPWADPHTRLRSGELIRLGQVFKDEAGQRAGVAITEPGIEGQLVQNEELRAYVKGKRAELLLKHHEPSRKNPQWDGLAGLEWRFTDGTYKPEGGPVTRYFPRDTVVVLPPAARLKSVLGYVEGKVYVPAQPSFQLVPQAPKGPRLSNALREQRGFYSYAELRADPIGIRIYAGWYGLPVILDPNAVLVYRTAAPAGVP
jgi:hypothetical protein